VAGIDLIFDLAVVSLVAAATALLCRLIHLSSVVGFLVAGMLIGPYTPPFQLVQDAGRIRVLADLGLLFLIFGIGLSFSIRRLRRLGASPVIGTLLTALLVLIGIRLIGSALGFSVQESLFIAGVLMVSSSAIISKVLEEIGSNHSRWGQLALGVTLLEDIVAVVMLTLLTSIATKGSESEESILQLLTSFTGFVALLCVGAMLLIPKLLRVMRSRTEILMLITSGLLLLLGWLADRLGYSMALTAFILGAIIGSTPQKPEIDKLFEGMRHLFGAVFFVAMGMLFDVGRIGEFWPALLALTAAAFLLRIPAATAALSVAGNDLRDALRAAFTVTPLGEFSFVIAFLGVQSGVMAESFYPAAVGASLLTCILSPLLIKRAEPLSDLVDRRQPKRLRRYLASYREWLDQIELSRRRSQTWNRVSGPLTSTLVYLVLMAGFIALATPGYNLVFNYMGPDLVFSSGTTILYIALVFVLLLAPITVIWRNIVTIATHLAESSGGSEGSGRARPLLQRGLALAVFGMMALWLLAVLPFHALPGHLLEIVLVVLVGTMILIWRTIDQWHVRIQLRLQEELKEVNQKSGFQEWTIEQPSAKKEWHLQVQEVTLPSTSAHAGRQLLELDLRNRWQCSVVGIDRNGFAINNPSATNRLFPGDRLLILGYGEALQRAAAFLQQPTERPPWAQQFDELATEAFTVPALSRAAGKSLAELDLVNRYGVQIAAIRRHGTEMVNPSGTQQILTGDNLLLLGTHEKIRECIESLR
jgi:CPA2 family monovalent cation:H+ antiporter-2